jgi:hypothetical protein
MHDFRDWGGFYSGRDLHFCDLFVVGVGAGYSVDSVRFRHKGRARIPDAITALLLALAFLLRLLLASFAAISTTTTTTTTTTAAALFALRCCRHAVDRCVVEDINLRYFLLGCRRLRGLIAFRAIAALLFAALAFATTTTLLLLAFVARRFAGFAFRTLAAFTALTATATTATAAATLTAAA